MDSQFPVGSTVVYAPAEGSLQRVGYVGQHAVVAGHHSPNPGQRLFIIAFPSGAAFPVEVQDLAPANAASRIATA